MKKPTLYLGSKSPSRQMLLQQAKIPFVLAEQHADEAACNWKLSLQEVVENIALHKMAHVILPTGQEQEVCFVVTADTLSQNPDGSIHGKPENRDDAIAMIKGARDGVVITGTAFCVERRLWQDGAWHAQERSVRYVSAGCEFIVPDSWIDIYLTQSPALTCAGAISIDEFGFLFLKSVTGSYTTIIGLPLVEVREVLEDMGYF